MQAIVREDIPASLIDPHRDTCARFGGIARFADFVRMRERLRCARPFAQCRHRAVE